MDRRPLGHCIEWRLLDFCPEHRLAKVLISTRFHKGVIPVDGLYETRRVNTIGFGQAFHGIRPEYPSFFNSTREHFFFGEIWPGSLVENGPGRLLPQYESLMVGNGLPRR